MLVCLDGENRDDDDCDGCPEVTSCCGPDASMLIAPSELVLPPLLPVLSPSAPCSCGGGGGRRGVVFTVDPFFGC